MFSIPVGTQFNMVGCGSYIIMVALIMRLTLGLPTDTEFLISFFEMAGIPAAAVTLFMGIDPLGDGIRTAGNVAGNIVSVFLSTKLEGKVDQISLCHK